ncbi:hypothetical protein SKAU_G00177480 [Synaphobranchus kaupii]|uniref:Uncharacterized protein n=1 Tax=Synaphobranchus kaupii TaxID=118154 RepID=A0A9Q1FLJ8_SYNKA|nr:hypothetical protein SKAU_G00177480 [Synaphobranchus kaupii]
MSAVWAGGATVTPEGRKRRQGVLSLSRVSGPWDDKDGPLRPPPSEARHVPPSTVPPPPPPPPPPSRPERGPRIGPGPSPRCTSARSVAQERPVWRSYHSITQRPQRRKALLLPLHTDPDATAVGVIGRTMRSRFLRCAYGPSGQKHPVAGAKETPLSLSSRGAEFHFYRSIEQVTREAASSCELCGVTRGLESGRTAVGFGQEGQGTWGVWVGDNKLFARAAWDSTTNRSSRKSSLTGKAIAEKLEEFGSAPESCQFT